MCSFFGPKERSMKKTDWLTGISCDILEIEECIKESFGFMEMKGNAATGVFMALAAGVCWGTSGLFIRELNGWGVGSFQAAMFRGGVGFLLLLAVMLIRRKESLKIRPRDLWLFVLVGGVGLAATNLAYAVSIRENPLAVAVVMLYAGPIVSTIGAAFLYHERITLRKVIALVCAFSGCVVMSGLLGGTSFHISAVGLIAGIVTGFGYGLYILGSRKAVEKYSSSITTLYLTMFYSFGTIPFALSEGSLPGALAAPLPVMVILLFGLVCTVIPYTLYSQSLKKIEVGKASVLSFSEPATATLIGLIIYREAFTLSTGIALGLILVSIIIMNSGSAKGENK